MSSNQRRSSSPSSLPPNACFCRPLPAFQVGDKVVAEGVANSEGAYKWRVTRLQLESAAHAAAAHAAAAAAQMPRRAGSGIGGAHAAAAAGGTHARRPSRGPALSGEFSCPAAAAFAACLPCYVSLKLPDPS